jgi:hypothetical protein
MRDERWNPHDAPQATQETPEQWKRADERLECRLHCAAVESARRRARRTACQSRVSIKSEIRTTRLPHTTVSIVTSFRTVGRTAVPPGTECCAHLCRAEYEILPYVAVRAVAIELCPMLSGAEASVTAANEL